MTPTLVLQTLIAITLIFLIVIQAKGTGLGRNFGASNYHTKRGMEKTIFYATVILGMLFVGISITIAL